MAILQPLNARGVMGSTWQLLNLSTTDALGQVTLCGGAVLGTGRCQQQPCLYPAEASSARRPPNPNRQKYLQTSPDILGGRPALVGIH